MAKPPIISNYKNKTSFLENGRSEAVLCEFIILSSATQCNTARSPEIEK
jgi:hypothetical protein